MIRFIFLTALIAGLCLASQPVAAQKKLPSVAELLGKLKEKRDSGGIQVYKLEFEKTSYDNARLVGTCHEEDEFQIDWSSGKFRWVRWAGCDSPPFEIIKTYDGEKIKTQFRNLTKDRKPIGEGEWKFGMVTGRLNSATYPREYWPMFFQKGTIAGLNDHYYPGHFAFEPDADKFFVEAEVVRNGQKCISLKTFPENRVTPMQYEYIVDPKKDYSVVSYTYYLKNAPYFTLDVDVKEAKQKGQWSARGWTLTSFNSSKVTGIVKVKVANFDEDVQIGENNKFDVVPPDGAKVIRHHITLPEGKQDLTDTRYEYEMKDGKLVQVAGPSPPLWDRIRENWHWFAFGAGLVVIAFAAFRSQRGWRRGPSAPSAPGSGPDG